MKRIAFVGRMRSGKDECANYLVDKYGYRQDALANPIKKIAYEQFGVTKEHPKGRVVLQVLGTEVGRYIDENFWIDKLLKSIKDMSYITISDVRFINEGKRLEENGFTLCRINATDKTRKSRGVLLNETHASEREIDDIHCDYEVENDGTLEELYAQLDFLFGDEEPTKKEMFESYKGRK